MGSGIYSRNILEEIVRLRHLSQLKSLMLGNFATRFNDLSTLTGFADICFKQMRNYFSFAVNSFVGMTINNVITAVLKVFKSIII